MSRRPLEPGPSTLELAQQGQPGKGGGDGDDNGGVDGDGDDGGDGDDDGDGDRVLIPG